MKTKQKKLSHVYVKSEVNKQPILLNTFIIIFAITTEKTSVDPPRNLQIKKKNIRVKRSPEMINFRTGNE